MKLDRVSLGRTLSLFASLSCCWIPAAFGQATRGHARAAPGAVPEYPPFEKVIEGYTKVESKLPDKGIPLCNVWTREKDGQMLIELPRDFAAKSTSSP